MADNELVAAILTLAQYSARPKIDSKQSGTEDWRHVVLEYQSILNELVQRQQKL